MALLDNLEEAAVRVNVISRSRETRFLLMLTGLVWLTMMGAACLFVIAAHNPELRALDIGDPAPPFTLLDQSGRQHKLQDYRGRTLALAFLPDLGDRSRRELVAINREVAPLDTLAIKVFAVVAGNEAQAKAVHRDLGLQFPILLDTGSSVTKLFVPAGLPELNGSFSYVIGADGKVLLPIFAVDAEEHGKQIVELTECCLDGEVPPPSPLIGHAIANVKLPRCDNGKLEELWRDKPVRANVVFIQSSECPCSAKYDQRMVEIASRYSRLGIRFVAINASANEPAKKVSAYAKAAGYPFPVLKDAGNRVADDLKAQVTPEAYLLDSKGVLRYHGRIDDSRDPRQVRSHDLRNALDFMLAGQAPPRPDVPAFGCAIFRSSKGRLK